MVGGDLVWHTAAVSHPISAGKILCKCPPRQRAVGISVRADAALDTPAVPASRLSPTVKNSEQLQVAQPSWKSSVARSRRDIKGTLMAADYESFLASGSESMSSSVPIPGYPARTISPRKNQIIKMVGQVQLPAPESLQTISSVQNQEIKMARQAQQHATEAGRTISSVQNQEIKMAERTQQRATEALRTISPLQNQDIKMVGQELLPGTEPHGIISPEQNP